MRKPIALAAASAAALLASHAAARAEGQQASHRQEMFWRSMEAHNRMLNDSVGRYTPSPAEMIERRTREEQERRKRNDAAAAGRPTDQARPAGGGPWNAAPWSGTPWSDGRFRR